MIDDFKRPEQPRPARLDGFRPQQPVAAPQNSTQPPAYNPYAPSQPPQAGPFEDPFKKDPYPPSGPGHDAKPPRKRRFTPIQTFRGFSRKKKAVVIILFVLVLIGGGGAAYALTRPEPVPAAKPKPAKVAPKPAPVPITSPLTGVVVTPEQQKRPVTGVMIENSPNARPQSGLKDAGIVFEAIAEAGITRFLALYQESAPGNIGPIRSARPYYLDWAMAFDATYAHVGGSPDALARIKEIGVKDLDQFANGGAYHRINTRFAPHNMYTSMDALVTAGNSRGYTSSTFTPLPRKAKEEPAQTVTAKAIDLGISSAFYNAHFDYDPATNGYKRKMGGTPHLDADSGTQLESKVVIALVMPYSLMADGYHSAYQTTGTGLATFFQDGTAVQGSWTKADPKSQFQFKDNAGNPIKLNAGQTWMSVVGDAAKVTYTP